MANGKRKPGPLAAGLGATVAGASLGRAVGEVRARRSLGRELNRQRAMHRPTASYQRAIPLLRKPARVIPPDPPLEDVLKRARARHRRGLGATLRARGAMTGGLAGALAGATLAGGLLIHRAVRRGQAKNAGKPMGGYAQGRRNVSHDAIGLRGSQVYAQNEYGTASVEVPRWARPLVFGATGGAAVGGVLGSEAARVGAHARAAMRPKWSKEIARSAGRRAAFRGGRMGALIGGTAGLSAAIGRAMARRRQPQQGETRDAKIGPKGKFGAGLAVGAGLVQALYGGSKSKGETREERKAKRKAKRQPKPTQVTLDPETLARLRNLQGYRGSTQLREYGQAVSGVI